MQACLLWPTVDKGFGTDGAPFSTSLDSCHAKYVGGRCGRPMWGIADSELQRFHSVLVKVSLAVSPGAHADSSCSTRMSVAVSESCPVTFAAG